MGDVGDEMTVERELTAGQTWLVRDRAGRRFVQKRLPEDCLKAGQLHPSVRLRLTRLRELPLACFVNLIGVQRDERRGIVMVCSYVEGSTFEALSVIDQVRLARALEHAVAGMHLLGMVHGAIHGRNVIVDDAGKLWLIDPSPLLHDDPSVDLRAVERLRGTRNAGGVAADRRPPDRADTVSRQRTLIAAVAILVLAIVAAMGIRHFLAE